MVGCQQIPPGTQRLDRASVEGDPPSLVGLGVLLDELRWPATLRLNVAGQATPGVDDA